MIREFCLNWTGSCRNRSKVTMQFLNLEYEFWEKLILKCKATAQKLVRVVLFSSFDLELVPKDPASRSFRSEA